MWVLGLIVIVFLFISGDSREKVGVILWVLRGMILIGAFVINPILGIIVFLIWQYIKSKIT